MIAEARAYRHVAEAAPGLVTFGRSPPQASPATL